MRYTSAASCITTGLLRFVRDSRPTEAGSLAWLGAEQQGRYHFLRKSGLLILQAGMVAFSPQHLSSNGKHLNWEHLRYNIDEETIAVFQAQEHDSPICLSLK